MAGSETKVRRLADVPVATGTSFALKAELFAGKHEARLSKAVGLNQFGVNHVTLEPGSISSLRHWHEGEDEFVYVLSGEVTLVDDNGEHRLEAGSFAGFPAGVANAHHLVNRSQQPASFIVVGTRLRGRETIHYPDDVLGPITIERDATGTRVAR